MHKIVDGRTIFYYDRAESKERALLHDSECSRFTFATLVIRGDDILKCRVHLEELCDFYFEKFSS